MLRVSPASFAGFKSCNQHITNHANSSYERDNYCNEPTPNFARLGRNHNHHYQYPWATFFIDRLRRPTLRVDALENDSHPAGPFLTQQGPQVPEPPSDEIVILTQAGTVSTPEHYSQSHALTWKERGESRYILTQTPRLRMKFGVLKVANLARKIASRSFCEGIATNLKADMQTLFLGSYSEQGTFSPYPSNLSHWSDRQQLSWYKERWYRAIDSMDGTVESSQNTVDEWKRILKSPLILWQYLRNTTLDMLPVGRDAYLLHS